MTREDIIRMVREVADKDKVDPYLNEFVVLTPEELERFAALVAEHERKKRHAAWHEGFEAGRKAERDFCAAVAEWTPDSTDTAHKIAAAIRARGNT